MATIVAMSDDVISNGTPSPRVGVCRFFKRMQRNVARKVERIALVPAGK